MKQYIDKSTVKAGIDELDALNIFSDTTNKYNEDYKCGYEDALESVRKFINTLEVKELNLEEELDEWIKYGPHTNYPWCTIPDAIKITAEHFFEFGLKAQKEK